MFLTVTIVKNCQNPIFGQVYIIVIWNDENMQNIVLFIQVNKPLKHTVRVRKAFDPTLTRNISVDMLSIQIKKSTKIQIFTNF